MTIILMMAAAAAVAAPAHNIAPSSQLTVRSTGLSGLGLALSVGALLVLALWWTRHVLSTRRAKQATVAALDHPSTGGARDG